MNRQNAAQRVLVARAANEPTPVVPRYCRTCRRPVTSRQPRREWADGTVSHAPGNDACLMIVIAENDVLYRENTRYRRQLGLAPDITPWRKPR